MAATPKPWEQRPDESSQAYAGFMVYIQLGSGRALAASESKVRGRSEGVRRASERYVKWSSDHEWTARARAYDEYQAGPLQKGIDQATVRRGREFAAIRDQELREGISRWRQRLKQSDVAAAMPLTTQTVHRDGKTVVIEATDLDVHRKATVIAARADVALWRLIDRGLELEATPATEAAKLEEAARPAGETTVAQKILAEWRAEQRRGLLTLPTEPPDDPTPAASAGSERNGSA